MSGIQRVEVLKKQAIVSTESPAVSIVSIGSPITVSIVSIGSPITVSIVSI